jgi:HprK-related kinase A
MNATLRQQTPEQLESALRRGLRLKLGPFVIEYRGRTRGLARRLLQHYPDYPLVSHETFADARLEVGRNPTPSRHWLSTRVIRTDDGQVFTTFPEYATLAHLEWTVNWAVATRSHQFLMLHAGVLANPYGALILPAQPGAGKSTLCAYLMHRGWRLLSDEFTLLRDESLAIHPFPRLIPLKNQSIDVIRDLVPEAALGPSIPGTHKGTVSHLRPPDDQIAAMHQTAQPRLMIFPQYVPGAKLEITPAARADCFVEITQNAFNYVLRGEEGFRMAAALADAVTPYRLRYSDLPAAAAAIGELMAEIANRAGDRQDSRTV